MYLCVFIAVFMTNTIVNFYLFIYLFEYLEVSRCVLCATESCLIGCKINTILLFFISVQKILVTHPISKNNLFTTKKSFKMTNE